MNVSGSGRRQKHRKPEIAGEEEDLVLPGTGFDYLDFHCLDYHCLDFQG